MKHFISSILYLVILGSIMFASCSKNDANLPTKEFSIELKDLIASSAMLRNQSFISAYGTINFNESITKKMSIGDSDTATLMVLPVFKDGHVVASIEAIKLPDGKLPYGDDYALNLVDFSDFNLKTTSGNIEMIDLNYDYYHHSKVRVKNNQVEQWVSQGLTRELEVKFNKPEFKQTSEQRTSINQNLRIRRDVYTLCDSSHDHNISFSECYKCATDAISADGFSSFVCEFPVLGWVSCWGSKTAACVVVSAQY